MFNTRQEVHVHVEGWTCRVRCDGIRITWTSRFNTIVLCKVISLQSSLGDGRVEDSHKLKWCYSFPGLVRLRIWQSRLRQQQLFIASVCNSDTKDDNGSIRIRRGRISTGPHLELSPGGDGPHVPALTNTRWDAKEYAVTIPYAVPSGMSGGGAPTHTPLTGVWLLHYSVAKCSVRV